MFMTKEDFMLLQQKQQESGLNLTAYLKRESLPYSNYHYWKRKFSDESGHSSAKGVMAPISFRNSPSAGVREGISVSMPDGLLVHFSPVMENAAMRFLSLMSCGHV
jgi:hypothetical protein